MRAAVGTCSASARSHVPRRLSNSVSGRSDETGGSAARRAGADGREPRARIGDVARDGGGQRFEVDVFFLVAQLLQEFDAHEFAIRVAVPVEQVYFEQHAAGI